MTFKNIIHSSTKVLKQPKDTLLAFWPPKNYKENGQNTNASLKKKNREQKRST